MKLSALPSKEPAAACPARRRRRLALASLLLAALSTTAALPASAMPVPQADRYLSMAFSNSTHGWYAVWSSTQSGAVNGALDKCNLYKSNDTYDCVSAGYAVNAYLAVALSKPYGAWGSWASTSATTAGKTALYYCKYYGGGNDCKVVFNRHSSEK